MRRIALLAAAIICALTWSSKLDAQTTSTHKIYLPYLHRDPTPTPDPVTCGPWLEDPSLETAWTDDNLGPTGVDMFPGEGTFNGIFVGDHWAVATKGRAILLRVDASTSRTGNTAVSFVGDGSMRFGWVLPRNGIGVGTDDGVESATLDFWYKMSSNSDVPQDSLNVEVFGLSRGRSSGPAIETRIVDSLPNTRTESTNDWTARSVDLGPFVHGFRTAGRRWDIVVVRFVGIDPDGDSTISRWRIDDIQITACTRKSNRPQSRDADVMLPIDDSAQLTIRARP